MTFFEYKNKFNYKKYVSLIEGTSANEVSAILNKEKVSFIEYLKLLSNAAEKQLPKIAVKSSYLTRVKFGKNIYLYAPLYISNDCVNSCLYCGFNVKNKVARKTLTIPEIKKEAQHLYSKGFNSVLVVSSENPVKVPVTFLIKTLKLLRQKFSSVSFEIYPLNTTDYKKLADTGADGLVIYQETYNETVYSQMHPAGNKRNYRYRLETPERAIAGGLKKISIGSLLGLNDFFEEAFYLGLHLDYLIKQYPNTFFSLSFPRLKNAPGNFMIRFPVSDKRFVQLLCALRLFYPETGINLSTREEASLRDNLINIGITSMSAGSKTNPGGYNTDTSTANQFDVSDGRTPEKIYQTIKNKGYQPVFKDWERLINEK